MKEKNFARGAFLTIMGGIFWGFSGTCGQFLLQRKSLTSDWLVPIRLFSAGTILLLICFLRQRKEIFSVWKEDKWPILIFGIFGMSMCQYTYFSAIAASNAGTATVLQYTGPVLILIYLSFRRKKLPTWIEILAIVMALLGTFFLATHGNPGSMVLSKEAFFWGIFSAVTLAIYTIQPGNLMEKYGSSLVTAWGMMIGGVVLCLLFRPWAIPTVVDEEVMAGMAAVVFLGTVVSFSCYMEGVHLIGPKKGSLYASIEPVAATIFSAFWLKVSFVAMDLLGFLCILSTIFLLSMEKRGR